VRIDTRHIPDTGLVLTENLSSNSLDLNTDIIKFISPIKAGVVVHKSYDAVCVVIELEALVKKECGRCLREFEESFNRRIKLDYSVDKVNPFIDLDTDIREEIILDYPLKALCSLDCKGLCPKCGCNLNETQCNCKY
jgi:uncharacterized protein